MDVTTLSENLFTAMKGIAEQVNENTNNIVVGNITNADNGYAHYYNVEIQGINYIDIYSSSTTLQVGDQVYLIQLENNLDKMIIGGLYETAKIIDLNKIEENYIAGAKAKLIQIDNRWVDQEKYNLDNNTNTKYYYEIQSLKDFNISDAYSRLYATALLECKKTGITQDEYGIHFRFVYKDNDNKIIYSYPSGSYFTLFSSDDMTSNPYQFEEEDEKEIKAFFDISNISLSTFNYIELQVFNNSDYEYEYKDFSLECGFDREELDQSRTYAIVSTIPNITNTSLEYSKQDTNLKRYISLQYVQVPEEGNSLEIITSLNSINNTEVRWYKYSYGEEDNDGYGGENWELLDRVINSTTKEPEKNDKGQYYLNYSTKSLSRIIELNKFEANFRIKGVIIIENESYTSNELNFYNTSLGGDEYQETNLVLKLDEYSMTSGNITEYDYKGKYYIYKEGKDLVNPVCVKLTASTETENADSVYGVVWKIPKVDTMLEIDPDVSAPDNKEYNYTIVSDMNYYYYFKQIKGGVEVNTETAEVELIVRLKQSFKADTTNNSIYCYLTKEDNTLPEVIASLWSQLNDSYIYTDRITKAIDKMPPIEQNGKRIYRLGFINHDIYKEQTKDDIQLFSYYEKNSVYKTFEFGTAGVNGTNYDFNLQFVSPVAYADEKNHNIIGPDRPYVFVQAILKQNGNYVDLHEYEDDLEWIFPDEENQFQTIEIAMNADDPPFKDTFRYENLQGETNGISNIERKNCRYWLVLPNTGITLNRMSTANDVEQSYMNSIIQLGRQFRNAIITLSTFYTFYDGETTRVFDRFTNDESLSWSVDLIKALHTNINSVNRTVLKECWQSLNSNVLKVLKKVYSGHKNSLENSFYAYRYCLQFLQRWSEGNYQNSGEIINVKGGTYYDNGMGYIHVYNQPLGEVQYGPGIVLPTVVDTAKDNLNVKNNIDPIYWDTDQEQRMSDLMGSMQDGWTENYNILKFEINKLNVDATLPIPTTIWDKEHLTGSGFSGNLNILYKSSGQINGTNQTSQFSFDDCFTASQTAVFLNVKTDDSFLNKFIKYEVQTGDNKDFYTKDSGSAPYGSNTGRIKFPSDYPGTSTPKVCLSFEVIVGGHSNVIALAPLYLKLDRYEKESLNKYNNGTYVNKNNSEIAANSLIIGKKSQYYSGWLFNKDGVELYKNGQVVFSINSNGEIRSGGGGNKKVTLSNLELKSNYKTIKIKD